MTYDLTLTLFKLGLVSESDFIWFLNELYDVHFRIYGIALIDTSLEYEE